MLFNSIEFLLFLPITFFSYWFLFNKNIKLQNLFIVFVSYLFYGWWDKRFLILIAITSFFSWLSGIVIENIRNNRKQADRKSILTKCKWIVGLNISLNLFILAFFKYYNFFVSNFVELFSSFGITLHLSTFNIILPVGISFYTFQALSYTIDVYRERIQPTRDIISFFAFVSFFPQLVAGPIERATNLLVQFYKPRTFSYDHGVDGIRLMMWGFFKKLVIADNCAPVVNDIFSNYMSYSASTLVMGAVLFAFQIYGDFSGYSDIAIGVSKLFGISLKRNFHYPYFSHNIIDFWKRWHISLNTWFVDYVYIPLGGKRKGTSIYIRNVFVVFFLSGLWHGANWTFIVWGIYNGLLLVSLFLLKNKLKYWPNWNIVFSSLVTFIFVLLGWIFFRSESISVAIDYIRNIYSSSIFYIPKVGGINNVYALISLFYILVLLVIEWINKDKSFGFDISSIKRRWVRYLLYTIIVFSIYYFGNNSSDFIYFQF